MGACGILMNSVAEIAPFKAIHQGFAFQLQSSGYRIQSDSGFHGSKILVGFEFAYELEARWLNQCYSIVDVGTENH